MNYMTRNTSLSVSYDYGNTDKCHPIVSGNRNKQIWAKLNRDIVWESTNSHWKTPFPGQHCTKDKTVWNPICISVLTRISVTVFSKSLPLTFQNIPLITMLFFLPYCSKLLLHDTNATIWSSNWLHRTLKRSFFSWNLLMATSFIFTIWALSLFLNSVIEFNSISNTNTKLISLVLKKF